MSEAMKLEHVVREAWNCGPKETAFCDSWMARNCACNGACSCHWTNMTQEQFKEGLAKAGWVPTQRLKAAVASVVAAEDRTGQQMSHDDIAAVGLAVHELQTAFAETEQKRLPTVREIYGRVTTLAGEEVEEFTLPEGVVFVLSLKGLTHEQYLRRREKFQVNVGLLPDTGVTGGVMVINGDMQRVQFLHATGWTPGEDLKGVELGSAEAERERALNWMNTAMFNESNANFWRQRALQAEMMMRKDPKWFHQTGVPAELTEFFNTHEWDAGKEAWVKL